MVGRSVTRPLYVGGGQARARGRGRHTGPVDEKTLVRLMPEHCCGLPVWGLKDAESTLSPELLQRLRAWQELWERDVAYPLPPDANPESRRRVVAEARVLRLAAQAELGDDYRVVTVAGERLLPELEEQTVRAEVRTPADSEFPAPQGPFWWDSLSVKEHNAQGSFFFPPTTISVEQVLDFWRHVQIPDNVLVALQQGMANQHRMVVDHRRQQRIEAVTQAWHRDRPEPQGEEERGVWLSDREQVMFDAERLPVPEPTLAWCEDFRSLARAIGLWRSQVDLINAGFDREDLSERILASALPWGSRAASVMEIYATFPLAEHWIPATPGATEPAMTWGIDPDSGAALLGI